MKVLLLFVLVVVISCDEKTDKFVKCVQTQVGKPYVPKAEGPDSFDIKGLIKYCATQAGGKEPDYDEGDWVKKPIAGDLLFKLHYEGTKVISTVYGIVSEIKAGEPPYYITGEMGKQIHIKQATRKGMFWHQYKRFTF